MNKFVFVKRSLIAVGLSLMILASVQAQSTGLKGRIRANSGSGISNATVTLTKGTADIKSARSLTDGRFEISGVEPGYYNLRVEADGYASASMFSVELKKGKVRDLGDKLFLRVDQGTLVIIRGSVFFKEGTSVTRAKVEIERINEDGSTKSLESTESSVSGEFVFRRPPGAAKYRITAKYNGSAAAKEISVENAAVYRVAISLDLSSKEK